MKRLLSLLLLLAAIPVRAASFESAEREVERSMTSGGVPGAAMVVVKDGRVVYAKAFGICSVETNVPVTTRTLFRIGSTTKIFVALAALRLVDQGALRLDGPIGDAVPDLAPGLRSLTLEQLLTHTAGLAEDALQNGPLDESALQARVTGWTEAALFASPGEVFSYANPGYVLAGAAIALAARQPFIAAMRSLVLEPAGMSDSTFRPLEAFTRPVALGHDKGGVIRPIAEHAGNYPPARSSRTSKTSAASCLGCRSGPWRGSGRPARPSRRRGAPTGTGSSATSVAGRESSSIPARGADTAARSSSCRTSGRPSQSSPTGPTRPSRRRPSRPHTPSPT